MCPIGSRRRHGARGGYRILFRGAKRPGCGGISMSVNKPGTILFSGFLIFATASVAPTQSTDCNTGEHNAKTHDRDAKAHNASESSKDASDRVSKAAAVLQDLTASPDKR